jgi:hypothetical protein
MVDISEIVRAKQTARPERSVPVWLRLCGVTVGEAIGVLEPGSRKKVQTEDCPAPMWDLLLRIGVLHRQLLRLRLLLPLQRVLVDTSFANAYGKGRPVPSRHGSAPAGQ